MSNSSALRWGSLNVQRFEIWARICKRLRSPEIDAKESIPHIHTCSLAMQQVRQSYINWRNRFLGSWNVNKFEKWAMAYSTIPMLFFFMFCKEDFNVQLPQMF